tara:strand:- start:3439 stop:4710 length:1272 start_codon:yes stop_codon:yes gene_type:complete
LSKKIKILTLSDHPLSPSGVGTQTKYMIEGLLNTGNYQVRSFGGAIKHDDYTPQKSEVHGDDWIIYPVDGYGNQESIRAIVDQWKPDILWFMTDPRFYAWLWDMDNEIRNNVPMVYYHVWDNRPYPHYNKGFYDSNDMIATISKVTDDVVKNVAPDVERIYLPHAVPSEIFKKLSEEEIIQYKKDTLPAVSQDKFIFFWNNRNAKRKMSGSVLWWFHEFLQDVGHDKAMLIMHTDPKDPYGQDLHAIVNHLGLTDPEHQNVLLSIQKYPTEVMASIYNIADCTINISDAEGFGLATLESLSCGTPIIVNMTGGLQEQVTDGDNWFGVGIQPASQAIIGSQDVPWIYEDRVSKEDFIAALKKMLNMSKEDREQLGQLGRAHVEKNYSFEKYVKSWDVILRDLHERLGSWETRKGYDRWTVKEIK